jgi:hypothetical protein
MTALTDLQASVANENAKVDLLIALVVSLKDEITTLQTAGGASVTDLQALQASIDAETAKVAALVAPAP